MLLYEIPSLQAAVNSRPWRIVLGAAGAYLMAGSLLYAVNRVAECKMIYPLHTPEFTMGLPCFARDVFYASGPQTCFILARLHLGRFVNPRI